MHTQIRQDLVIDVSGFTPKQRDDLFDLQLGILAAKYHEADADRKAAQSRADAEAEWAKRASIGRQEEELKLADQLKQEAFNEKSRDLALNRERQWQRPSYTLRVEITSDPERNQFKASFGNLSAWGDTPEMACDNFDHLWLYGELA